MEQPASGIENIGHRRAVGSDAAIVAGWFANHDDATRWGGPEVPNPLTADWLESEIADGSYFVGVDRAGDIVAIYGLKTLDENVLHLRRFAVAPRLRGQGAGKLLIRQIADFARSQGAPWLSLWVYGSNTAARRLYEQAGFLDFGQRAAAEDPTGVCLRMRLDL